MEKVNEFLTEPKSMEALKENTDQALFLLVMLLRHEPEETRTITEIYEYLYMLRESLLQQYNN